MLLKRELENVRSHNSNNNNNNSSGGGATMETSAAGGGGGTMSSKNAAEIEELNRELATLKARNESLEMELLNQQTIQMKLNSNSKDTHNLQNVKETTITSFHQEKIV